MRRASISTSSLELALPGAASGTPTTIRSVNPDVRVILVEKTDRLYRNLKDWVTVDELDAEIHLSLL